MPDLPDDIARINALTTNARNTWFALLGVLVFVGITLMGVEHIDFYGVDRATQLPLVNVEVPTRYFFIAAPILVAAIYGYFHLYLIRLWDTLSVAAPVHGTRPLGDVIAPWLVTDAALHLRARLRKDGCTTPRTMEGPAMALNFLLAWGFGLIVLVFLWWQSMPARWFLLTGVAGASLLISLFTGAASLAMLILRMRAAATGKEVRLWSSAPAMGALLVLIPAILLVGHQRTVGTPHRLAHVAMAGEAIVNKPSGWRPFELDRRRAWQAHCAPGNNQNHCSDRKRTDDFDADLREDRLAQIAEYKKPDLTDTEPQTLVTLSDRDIEAHYRSAFNLSYADMRSSFLSGLNLSGIVARHANFEFATLEATSLLRADVRNSNFRHAKLHFTVLFRARMEESDLTRAVLHRTNLSGAKLMHAGINFAVLRDTRLRYANLNDADLSFSLVTGNADRPIDMTGSRMQNTQFTGSALRYVDLNAAVLDDSTDLRNSFGDASVLMRDTIEKRLGRPCQWAPDVISDEEFFGRWRGWLDERPRRLRRTVDWASFVPAEYRNVKPIPPPAGCKWHQ